MGSVDAMFVDIMLDIKIMGKDAIDQINQRADEIAADLHFEQFCRYDRDQHKIQEEINQYIYPHSDIAAWWESLPSEERDKRDKWYELYRVFWYGVDGDLVISEDNHFAFEVMRLLRGRDSYLNQPFCPWCDSRGHESGACMRS